MSFNHTRKLKKNPLPFCEAHGCAAVVKSRSGRSRGKYFVTVDVFRDVSGKLFAKVCDGKSRTRINPKRKSALHLETILPGNDLLREELTDERIKQLLEKFR